jgi:DNA-binding XRE family transcriptional regulator
MKKGRPTHEEFKKMALQDLETKQLYDDLEEEYALLEEMIHARQDAGKTQAEVAELMGIKTSAVGRLESALFYKKHSPSLATIKKYAHALGYRLQFKLVSEKEHC